MLEELQPLCQFLLWGKTSSSDLWLLLGERNREREVENMKYDSAANSNISSLMLQEQIFQTLIKYPPTNEPLIILQSSTNLHFSLSWSNIQARTWGLKLRGE